MDFVDNGVQPHSGIRKQKIRLGRCRIVNQSDTSSFNTALTTLSHIPCFVNLVLRDYIQNYYYNTNINPIEYESFRYIIDGIIWCLWAQEDNPTLCKYINQLSILLFPEKQDTSIQMPVDVVEILCLIINNMNGLYQKEYILPSFPVVEKYDSAVIQSAWKEFKMRTNSIIQKFFYGLYYNHFHCPHCGDHYQFEYFNMLSIPVPEMSQYIYITFISYFPINESRSKKNLATFKTNYKPCKCLLQYDSKCSSLYDQMVTHTTVNYDNLDILIYKKDTSEYMVLPRDDPQTKLTQYISRNFYFLCLYKTNPGKVPIAVQPVLWRYVNENGMRNSHFTKAPFPFFVYTYPSSSYNSLFKDVYYYIHPNYRSHARHFQDRLENLMPLVDVDYSWNMKREREKEEEEEREMKKMKEDEKVKEEGKENEMKIEEKEIKMEEEKMEENGNDMTNNENGNDKTNKENGMINNENGNENNNQNGMNNNQNGNDKTTMENGNENNKEIGNDKTTMDNGNSMTNNQNGNMTNIENGNNMTNIENGKITNNQNGKITNNQNGINNNTMKENSKDGTTVKESGEKDITAKIEKTENTDVNKSILESMKTDEVISNISQTKPPTTINTEGIEGWRTYEEISWKEKEPYFPILNTRYFSTASTLNETVNWMNYIFSAQSFSAPVNQFINLKATQKPLYLVLDVDEGDCTIIPDYLGKMNREKIWKDQCLMNPFPERSSDPSEFYHDEDIKKKSFEDCINREFFRKTKEGKEEECLFCKNRGLLSKQISFYSLPKCLLIHLQRASFFKLNEKSFVNHKIVTAVDYPLTMDLSRYFTPEKRKSCKYELTAVVCHSTQIPNSHFYVLCKDNVEDEEKWVLYDDEEIRFISNSEIVTPEAYILVYIKQNEKKITGKDNRDLILNAAI